MSKSLLLLLSAILIAPVGGTAMAQDANDAAAPAMTGATNADKPAQPEGASGTGAGAKTGSGPAK